MNQKTLQLAQFCPSCIISTYQNFSQTVLTEVCASGGLCYEAAMSMELPFAYVKSQISVSGDTYRNPGKSSPCKKIEQAKKLSALEDKTIILKIELNNRINRAEYWASLIPKHSYSACRSKNSNFRG